MTATMNANATRVNCNHMIYHVTTISYKIRFGSVPIFFASFGFTAIIVLDFFIVKFPKL